MTEADRQGTGARAAILARLADGSHQHLNDLLWAGSRRGDSLPVYRRLTELGVTDERAVRIVRTRDRIMRWFLLLSCVPLAGVIVALAAMREGATTGAGVGVLVLVQGIAVAALGPRGSGGWFRPLTPDGRAALERARERVPAGPDDRMLHRAALDGLEIFPEFQAAAARGTPDAGLGPRQRHGSALLDLLQSIADLFGPGPGTRQR